MSGSPRSKASRAVASNCVPRPSARIRTAFSMGIAARYIHSHVSIIDRRDYESTAKLLVALVQRLDEKTVASLT